MKVMILFGGRSSEHEISIMSATSIVKKLNAKHEVALVGIDRNGKFFLQSDAQTVDLRNGKIDSLKIEKSRPVALLPAGGRASFFEQNTGKTIDCDVVFPVLHGQYCEDGVVQGLLESLNLPYVGPGVCGSAVCFDKEKTKIICEMAKIPVVDYICARKNEMANFAEILAGIKSKLGFPGKAVFVKPVAAGSSVGARKACDESQLKEALNAAFLIDEKVLVERFVRAREIECAVLGNPGKAKCFAPGEISTSDGEHDFYDYDAKYCDPNGAKTKTNADLPAGCAEKIRGFALRAYHALDLCGLSRVDFFLDKDSGEVLLNEINTIPGFTTISMYPKMCESGGLDYTALLDELLRLAIERFEERQKLSVEKS